MITIDINEMLEAGLQFGHLTSIWNPANKTAIKKSKDGVHIFDMNNTAVELQKALSFFSKMIEERKDGMIVSTKLQSHEAGANLSAITGFPNVVSRWVGGTLTNFDCVRKRSQTLRDLNRKFETGEIHQYVKKEQVKLSTRRVRLAHDLRGLENLIRKPQFIIVSSAFADASAIREANQIGIKVIAVVDSNADPKGVDFPIHANDDAKSSLDYIFNLFAQTANIAKSMKKED